MQVGIETYATKTQGVGGAIRSSPEDFVVQEVLADGSKATVDKIEKKTALGATSVRQRFLLCELVKKNWDTFIAIKNVAKELGIAQSRVQIAGIKDAKAVTAQHITIEDVSAKEVTNVHIKDIDLRPIGYFQEQLSPFYLLGNDFKININAIPHSKETIEQRTKKNMAELAAIGGIPNFYGHQRFGTIRPITHLVGKAIVQGKLEEAAMLFLAKPSPHEHPESRNARIALQKTQDFKQALQEFPPQLRFERIMLTRLKEDPKDFAGAFRRLPLKLRLLFVQAYQSFLFNRFLSQRIRSNTPLNQAEPGDFVVNVERSGLPMVRTGKIVDETRLHDINESIRSGRMRIALPIIGFSQRLSQGQIGEAQHNILEEEAIIPQNFRTTELPEINGRGELRTAISPIKDFSMGTVSPELGSAEMHRTQMQFTLLRSSYATILLREVMKPKDLIAAGF